MTNPQINIESIDDWLSDDEEVVVSAMETRQRIRDIFKPDDDVRARAAVEGISDRPSKTSRARRVQA